VSDDPPLAVAATASVLPAFPCRDQHVEAALVVAALFVCRL